MILRPGSQLDGVFVLNAPLSHLFLDVQCFLGETTKRRPCVTVRTEQK